MEEETATVPLSRKESILARFDEAGQVLFGGRLHTDREELEAAIEGGADSPKRHRGAVDILQQTQAALLQAQADLKAAEAKLAATSPLEGTPQHEIAISALSPGSAFFVPTGDQPATGDSLFGYWCVPGDFRLHLQPGESGTRSDGLVREIIVGSYRHPEDSDFEFDQGTFIPDSEWDAVVGAVHRENLQLRELIGELPEGAHPDEIKPRAASFMAERGNWETEVGQLRTAVSQLKARVEELQGESSTATAQAPALPENSLELIQTAGGIGKAKAEAIIAALTTPAAPTP